VVNLADLGKAFIVRQFFLPGFLLPWHVLSLCGNPNNTSRNIFPIGIRRVSFIRQSAIESLSDNFSGCL
jgi:hypothetical protein